MMAAETMPPHTAPRLERPPTLHDPKVEALAQMFPDIDNEVLALFLSHNGYDIEKAVVAILDSSPPPQEEDLDAQIAQLMQMEQDEAVARAVHTAIQKELKDEEARQLAARAERAVGQAAATTASAASRAASKAFVLQRLARARAAKLLNKGGSSSSTHSARLLDGAVGSEAYDMSPLTAPLSSRVISTPDAAEYAPPALVMETPSPPTTTTDPFPSSATTTTDPFPSTTPADPFPSSAPAADPFPTPVGPSASSGSVGSRGSSGGSLIGQEAAAHQNTAHQNTEKRYSSRMDRARSSNTLLGRSARAVVAPTQPLAVPPFVVSGPSAGSLPDAVSSSVAPLVSVTPLVVSSAPPSAAVPEGELI